MDSPTIRDGFENVPLLLLRVALQIAENEERVIV